MQPEALDRLHGCWQRSAQSDEKRLYRYTVSSDNKRDRGQVSLSSRGLDV